MRKIRPLLSLAVVALTCLVYFAILNWHEQSLGLTSRLSGYTLTGVCVVMLLLPLRKRLILLNFGRVAMWQQLHHFAGLFSIVAYFLHAGWSVNGYLESTLAGLFIALTFSGLGHWYVNRRIPKLMRAVGPPLRTEELMPRRLAISNQAYSIALAAASDSDSAGLADLYSQSLNDYFHQLRSFTYYVRPTGVGRRKLQSQLDSVARYLNPKGQKSKEDLSDLVRQRDDVDFQSAMMIRIRCWNVAHVVLTWSFVLVAIVHIYAAHRFAGN